MRRAFLVLITLCLGVGGEVQAQGQISGRVTDAADGRPIARATVAVVGTNQVAATDTSGAFLLAAVPAGAHQVRARLIGYAPVTRTVVVQAAETTTVDFQLVAAPLTLEGLVVVGYGTQERRDLTGAVTTVNAAQIAETPTPNVIQAIQARVPGVDVVSSGSYRPGVPMNVRIRGVRSMVASNEPLIVVDGVPLAGGIEDFNPAMIASIEVLKDASATAVYGSRGANGVILITTVRGAAGAANRVSINYDASFGTQHATRLADMMDGPEFAELVRESRRFLGQPSAACVASWTANCDTLVFTTDELPYVTSGRSTDWQHMVLRTGYQRRNQLGLNVNTGNNRLSLTGTVFSQDGISLAQGYNQYMGTLTFENVTGRLRVGVTAAGSRSVADIGGDVQLWGEALANNPLGAPYDSAGVGVDHDCNGCTLKVKPTPDPLRTNPLREARGYVRQQTRDRAFGSAYAELQLGRGFSYRVNFGPDVSNRTDGQFHGAQVVVGNLPIGNPEAAVRSEHEFAFTLDNILNYHRNFGTSHRVDATLLYGIQKDRFTADSVSAQGLPYEYQLWYNLGTAETVLPPWTNLSEWTLASYMTRVSYALADRYLLTLTGRWDGSSRLAPQHRWSFSPSLGLGWRLGDEPFMRRLGWISGLKLRFSAGRVGNTAIDPYQTEGSLTRTRYNYGSIGAFGYIPGSIPNPDLKWEYTSQINVGVDFGVLNNRLSGTLDMYRERTNNLLSNRQLPGTSGFTSTLLNVGESQNQGYELSLSGLIVPGRGTGFQWTTDLNLTHNENDIISLGGKVLDDPNNRWFIGQPINVGGNQAVGGSSQPLNSDALRNVFYDYLFDGIWQLADSASARRYGQQPGDIRVRDLNGDGVINAADRVVRGNTYPRLIASSYHRLSFRGFDLSFLLQGRIGYTFYDAFGTSANALFARFNNLNVQYWTPTKCDGGPDPTVLDGPAGVTAEEQAAIPGCDENPRPRNTGQEPLYNTSRGYRTGTHWRVRNITFGYTVPSSVASRYRMSAVRIYVQAQDPFVFTSYHGYDPEAGSSATPPPYRTVLVGMNVGF